MSSIPTSHAADPSSNRDAEEARLSPALRPTAEEFACIERLARDLAAIGFHEDAERYVGQAQVLWDNMPSRYQVTVDHFRRCGAREGALHLVGLPTGPVPPTPMGAELAAESSPLGAAVLSLIAAGLGEQVGFAAELSGLIVQGVVPMKGAEFSQRSVSSLSGLLAHVETSFSEHRPDHVGLFCLRADHDRLAGTTVAPVEAMLRGLPADVIGVLRQPRFATTVDESFSIGAKLRGSLAVDGMRVLSGPIDRPDMRVDFAETRGTDDAAAAALDSLRAAAMYVERTVYLASGAMLLIDNNHAVHGRTAFFPKWDGQDRWLLRTFTTCDLARSAGLRPNDGRVIDITLDEAH